MRDIRVMIESGKKKRTVAVAFDWPGWDRSGKAEDDALQVLDAYRPRYAKVAALAGLADEFGAAGNFDVVERVEGIGMTDYYGLSGRWSAPETEPMSEAECERKIALLRAAWATFDAAEAQVSPELKKGPRGGGRERDEIIRHCKGWEIGDLARKVGVVVPDDAWRDPKELGEYRDAFVAAIREFNASGSPARTWPLQFLMRRCAWHMLDHAWEMEDRDLSN
jgi:hypothetical protein